MLRICFRICKFDGSFSNVLIKFNLNERMYITVEDVKPPPEMEVEESEPKKVNGVVAGQDTNSIFSCFLFCENSLICLEGKSMTPH